MTLEDFSRTLSADVRALNPHIFAQNAPQVPKNASVGHKKNKYGAVRTYSTLCCREFASKAEARRGEELTLLQQAGEIESLRFQIPFVLSARPKITVTIDFGYIQDGVAVYEDTKGVLTRDSRTKYAWLAEKHGVVVKITK